MAQIGVLGNIVFSVSNKTVRTFNNMKWESSVKYGTHERVGRDTLIEAGTINPDIISLTVALSAYCGVNPKTEMAKMETAMRNFETLRFILGNNQIGTYKWVIEKLSREITRVDSSGNILGAIATLGLKSYSKR